MAKKKAKKKIKRAKKKVVRAKKKARKVKSKAKKTVRKKVVIKQKKEKVIAVVDHFFGKISVAAFKLKAPLRVGDMIHIKGHTTDFVQKVDSMQIEHQSVPKAGKGAEVGIKVRGKVRAGDTVYFATGEKELSAPPAAVQKPMFPAASSRPPSPQPPTGERPITPPSASRKPGKENPYGNTRFLKF